MQGLQPCASPGFPLVLVAFGGEGGSLTCGPRKLGCGTTDEGTPAWLLLVILSVVRWDFER